MRLLFWRRRPAPTGEDAARQALAGARAETDSLRRYRPVRATAEDNLRTMQPPGAAGL